MGIRRTLPLAIALLLAAACSADTPLDAALEERAKAAIVEHNTQPVTFSRLWLAEHGEHHGLVCGEFEAPESLRAYRDRVRFVYEDRSQSPHIEYHELWVGPASGMALVERNRVLFNQLWENSCAPAEPGRLTAFFR